jgi:hypothetical protein
MKKINVLLIACLAIILGSFTSCEKEDSSNNIIIEGNALIANYGGYNKANGEISLFNETSGEITNNYYSTKTGIPFTSNIQSITKHNGNLFFMSNASDKIDVVSLIDFKALPSISTDITKPRHMVAKGNKAYVSCWGNVVEWAIMANSYIAIINLDDNSVKKILRPGGFEGMAIIGNKLYAAAYDKKEIAVLDLDTEKFLEPIAIPALARQLVVDGKKLWVSHISSYSIPVDASLVGISCINTTNNTIERTVNIPNIGSNGLFETNANASKIYVLAKEAYPSTASNIILVDALKGEIENDTFITGESFYGMGFNKTTDKLYVMISPNSSTNGSVRVYNNKAEKLIDKVCGISPLQVLFY